MRIQSIGKCIAPFKNKESITIANTTLTFEADCAFFQLTESSKNISPKVGADLNGSLNLLNLSLKQIPAIDKALNDKFGIVYKSGFKTGTTCGHHISTLSIFRYKNNSSNISNHITHNKPFGVEELKYMLIHSASGVFAIKGDSGSLVWSIVEDNVVPLGILVGSIDSHLYIVLPLSFIEYAFNERGYAVKWNT